MELITPNDKLSTAINHDKRLAAPGNGNKVREVERRNT